MEDFRCFLIAHAGTVYTWLILTGSANDIEVARDQPFDSPFKEVGMGHSTWLTEAVIEFFSQHPNATRLILQTDRRAPGPKEGNMWRPQPILWEN